MEDKIKAIEKLYHDLPGIIGSIAVTFSKQRFVEQNWLDTTPDPWPQRKTPDKNKRRRALLVKSGRLKRSIRIVRSGHGYVIIGSDVPYAQAHNDGLTIDKTVNVRAHSRAHIQKIKITSTNLETQKTSSRSRRMRTGTIQVSAHTRQVNTVMPMRRFLGDSAHLSQLIESQIETLLNKTIE